MGFFQQRKMPENPLLVTKRSLGLHTGRKQLEGRAWQAAAKASNVAKRVQNECEHVMGVYI